MKISTEFWECDKKTLIQKINKLTTLYIITHTTNVIYLGYTKHYTILAFNTLALIITTIIYISNNRYQAKQNEKTK